MRGFFGTGGAPGIGGAGEGIGAIRGFFGMGENPGIGDAGIEAALKPAGFARAAAICVISARAAKELDPAMRAKTFCISSRFILAPKSVTAAKNSSQLKRPSLRESLEEK